MDIGSEFGLSGYSSVSSVSQEMSKQLQENRKLQERYEDLWKPLIIRSNGDLTPFLLGCVLQGKFVHHGQNL